MTEYLIKIPEQTIIRIPGQCGTILPSRLYKIEARDEMDAQGIALDNYMKEQHPFLTKEALDFILNNVKTLSEEN